MQSVENTYKLRNIFCHEFAVNVRVDPDDIKSDYLNCRIFLEQGNDFICDLLYPTGPQTQLEMNDQEHEEFESLDKELTLLFNMIKEISKVDDSMLDFDPKLFGGSMYAMIYDVARKNITSEKIRSLEKEFEKVLRKSRIM